MQQNKNCAHLSQLSLFFCLSLVSVRRTSVVLHFRFGKPAPRGEGHMGHPVRHHGVLHLRPSPLHRRPLTAVTHPRVTHLLQPSLQTHSPHTTIRFQISMCFLLIGPEAEIWSGPFFFLFFIFFKGLFVSSSGFLSLLFWVVAWVLCKDFLLHIESVVCNIFTLKWMHHNLFPVFIARQTKLHNNVMEFNVWEKSHITYSFLLFDLCQIRSRKGRSQQQMGQKKNNLETQNRKK